MRVPDAVGARVAAADHDDVPACRRDRRRRGAGDHARALGEVLHREVHAAELAAGHGQVARNASARREHDRVVVRSELRDVEVAADVDAEPELDALGDQLRDPALDERASRS